MTDYLLDLDRLPDTSRLYLRLLKRKPPLPVERSLPRLSARLNAYPLDTEKLADYRRVCGFPRGDHLPNSYFYVLAQRLHICMLSDSRFPISLLGMVHYGNQIDRLRDVGAMELEQLDIETEVADETFVSAGRVFHVNTRFAHNGDVYASMVSRYLHRGPTTVKDESSPPPAALPDFAWQQDFDFQQTDGRRYARVSGDFNPIHLTPWAARLFGFPRHIAHGMYSMARIEAFMETQLGQPVRGVDVRFKKAVFLPGTGHLKWQQSSDGEVAFMLTGANDLPHLQGKLHT